MEILIQDIEEAERHVKRKSELQERLFGIKYTEEQHTILTLEAVSQLSFARFTLENAMSERRMTSAKKDD